MQTFLQCQADHAKWTSTFFDIPHVTVDTIKIDWLHAADLGVITDFLGNFFWYLTMFKVNGGMRHGTHQQRCEDFFNTDIKGYYARERIEDRIPCLRPTMMKKDGGSYKLRAKGGETRGLIGIIRELIAKYLDGGVPLERAMGHTGQQVVTDVCMPVAHKLVPSRFRNRKHRFYERHGVAGTLPSETGRSALLGDWNQSLICCWSSLARARIRR